MIVKLNDFLFLPVITFYHFKNFKYNVAFSHFQKGVSSENTYALLGNSSLLLSWCIIIILLLFSYSSSSSFNWYLSLQQLLLMFLVVLSSSRNTFFADVGSVS